MNNIVNIADKFAAANPVLGEWAEPTPLPGNLLPVPAFDIDMLPTRLAPWVDDISNRLAIPADYAGIAAMVSAGAMIGSKLAVRPQAHTPWSETFNLFGVIIGNPSALKTPAVSEVLAPIRRMEARLNAAYDNELAHHEMEMHAYAIQKDVAEKRARKLFLESKNAEANALLIGNEPKPPRKRRLLVGNTTVEKLGEVCRDNPDGILIDSDEVVTFLNDLSHPEKEAQRGFVMAGWRGLDPYVFDRIVRGTVRVDRVTLSLIGTSQPEIYARYLRDSVSRRPDGLAQRMQLLAWPDMIGEWRNVDRPAHKAAREEAFSCFEQLYNLIPESIGASRDEWDGEYGMPFLRFAPDAQEQFNQWRGDLERRIRNDELSPAMRDHLGKYRGLSARLAGICHIASGDAGPISSHAMGQALEWMSYLDQHAQRAWGSLTLDRNDAARAILRRIVKGQLVVDGFTEKDVYKNDWTGLGKGPRLTEALKALCDYDWLHAEVVSTGGRPKTIYRPNPRGLDRIPLLN